jgi:hypothetical protein
MAEISVKQRYINITVDVEKIHGAFSAVCDDAHSNAQGDAGDALYLSYHQCKDSDELRRAQALLKTVEMAQAEGCIQSTEPFSLQQEYDEFLRERSRANTADQGLTNRPDPYKGGR